MISINEFNTAITALNQMSQACHDLAQLLSDLAWERVEDHAGMRGAQPALPVETGSVPTTPDSTPVVEDPPGYVSIEEVRPFLAELSQSGYTSQVKELIARFGVSKLSEVAEADLGTLLQAAKELSGHGS